MPHTKRNHIGNDLPKKVFKASIITSGNLIIELVYFFNLVQQSALHCYFHKKEKMCLPNSFRKFSLSASILLTGDGRYEASNVELGLSGLTQFFQEEVSPGLRRKLVSGVPS